MKQAANFILFQIGWFSCVLGAANGIAWLGPVVVLAAVLVHLKLSLRPAAELKLILSAVAIGLVVDSLILATGWISYPAGVLVEPLAPYWILAMWALFATTLNVSMGWLKHRVALGFVMGAVGGPMSYWAGQKMGAMTFIEPLPALAALAIAWAIAMPLLSGLAAHFNGRGAPRTAEVTPWPWQVSGGA